MRPVTAVRSPMAPQSGRAAFLPDDRLAEPRFASVEPLPERPRGIIWCAMNEAASATHTPMSRPLLLAAAIFGAVLVATLLLWLHFGTAVFYEMIVAGLAACF